jgi:hypothetical protein
MIVRHQLCETIHVVRVDTLDKGEHCFLIIHVFNQSRAMLSRLVASYSARGGPRFTEI